MTPREMSPDDHSNSKFYGDSPIPKSRKRSLNGSKIESSNCSDSDENACLEEDFANQVDSKRPRLTANQSQLLEESFKEDMKLEPERKKRLSAELGINIRQVAVWFQNRRSRWKSKRLEDDYDNLKNNYETLMQKHEVINTDYEKLKVDYGDLFSQFDVLRKQMTRLLAKTVELGSKVASQPCDLSVGQVYDKENQFPNLVQTDALSSYPVANSTPLVSCSSDASIISSELQTKNLFWDQPNFLFASQTPDDSTLVQLPSSLESLESIVWSQSDKMELNSYPAYNDVLLDPLNSVSDPQPEAFWEKPFATLT